jgi:hypothetical protein
MRAPTALLALAACQPTPPSSGPPELALQVEASQTELGRLDLRLALSALAARGPLPPAPATWAARTASTELQAGVTEPSPPLARGDRWHAEVAVSLHAADLQLGVGDDWLDLTFEAEAWGASVDTPAGARLLRAPSIEVLAVEAESPERARVHLLAKNPNSQPIEVLGFSGSLSEGGARPWQGRAWLPPADAPTPLSLLVDGPDAPASGATIALSGTFSASTPSGVFVDLPFGASLEATSGCLRPSGWFFDDDGDGFGIQPPVEACAAPGPNWSLYAGDCEGDDPAVHPGAPERCNGVDDDCDEIVDNGELPWADAWPDLDGDGWGDAASDPVSICGPKPGWVGRAGDCDDDDPERRPGVADHDCDEIDDDCDGVADQDAERATVYADEDGDGEGDPASARSVCNPAWTAVRNSDDCDDADPAVNTRAIEACDGVDEDCDGRIDEALPDAHPKRVCVGGLWWSFDTEGAVGGGEGAAVSGPGENPMGAGALSFALDAGNQKAKWSAPALAGLRLDALDALAYAAYRASPTTTGQMAFLQFKVDASGARTDAAFDGYLTWEPTYAGLGTLQIARWYEMDLATGRGWHWVQYPAALGTNPCTTSAPCTLAQILARHPDARVHPAHEGLYFKAGSGWTTHRGFVDYLVVELDGGPRWLFDFEAYVAD